MDHVSAGKSTRDGARTRRRRMREQARSQHAAPSPATDRYQTPEWLDRSFVLPLTQPEASGVPSQPVPHHDDVTGHTGEPLVIDHPEPGTLSVLAPLAPAAPFVRPHSDHIDFARVIRRSDLSRKAARLAWAAAGVGGVALIAYLLSASVVALGATVALALVSATSLAWRAGINHAPVPRVQR